MDDHALFTLYGKSILCCYSRQDFNYLILQQITKELVDVIGFAFCQLHVKWTQPKKQPVDLVHQVTLNGAAKNPSGFLLLKIEPQG